MDSLALLLVLAIIGPGAVASPEASTPEPAWDSAGFEATWSCSRALAQQCSLAVGLTFVNPASARLRCVLSPPHEHLIQAEQALSESEVRAWLDWLQAAEPFDASPIGVDPRPRDGCLTTLIVGRKSRSVALVTSGNPQFESDGPRHRLVKELESLHRTLFKQALEAFRADESGS